MLLSTRRSADRATSLAAPLQISSAARRVRYRERSSRTNSPRVAWLAPAAARFSLVIDASQLVAEEGQVPFDSSRLNGCACFREFTLASSNQVFEDLAGGADVVEVGRDHRVLGDPQDRGPLPDRDHYLVLAHVTRRRDDSA